MSSPNSSSSAITSSTMSSESAPRSSMNLASGVSCLTSTSNSLAMISLTLFSSNDAIWIHLLCMGFLTRSSLHDHATVDRPSLTGDIGGARRRQECDHLRDILGGPQSAQWDTGLELGLRRLGELRRHLRRDVTRTYRVHRDRAAGELARQRLREPEQARLAGGVVRLARVTHEADHGRHVHDAAIARLHHRARDRARAAERAGE